MRPGIRLLALMLPLSILSPAARSDEKPAPKAVPTVAKPARRIAAARPSDGLIDLNSASAVDLAALPSVGEANARKIIAGRPYHIKKQLVTRKILPQALYDQIAGRVIARQLSLSAPHATHP